MRKRSPSRKKWAGSSLGIRQVVSGQDRVHAGGQASVAVPGVAQARAVGALVFDEPVHARFAFKVICILFYFLYN